MEESPQSISPKPVDLSALLEGTVDLGFGITISPIMRGSRLVAVTFSHEIQDYGEPSQGTCSKILPLRRRLKKKRGYGYSPGWTLKKHVSGLIDLYPSCECPEHHLHGWVKEGEWVPMRAWVFSHMAEDTVAQKMAWAENRIKEFGGGYEGAVLALAAWAPNSKPKWRTSTPPTSSPGRLFD